VGLMGDGPFVPDGASRMGKARKYCLFCGEPDYIRGKEHVFAQWLLDHLGIRSYRVAPTFNRRLLSSPTDSHMEQAEFERTVLRRHTLSALNGTRNSLT
jgi:hypothetical protein